MWTSGARVKLVRRRILPTSIYLPLKFWPRLPRSVQKQSNTAVPSNAKSSLRLAKCPFLFCTEPSCHVHATAHKDESAFHRSRTVIVPCSPPHFSVSNLQPGALQQSENGFTNAEKFYKLMRPYEGAARIQRPSITTESGYKFSTYTAKV